MHMARRRQRIAGDGIARRERRLVWLGIRHGSQLAAGCQLVRAIADQRDLAQACLQRRHRGLQMKQKRCPAHHGAVRLARPYAQAFGHVQHRQARGGHRAVQAVHIPQSQAAVLQRQHGGFLQLIERRAAGRVPAPRIADAHDGAAAAQPLIRSRPHAPSPSARKTTWAPSSCATMCPRTRRPMAGAAMPSTRLSMRAPPSSSTSETL
ncbi:Uncharacterised protein [Bordetella hinzii]|nr:Uncharacterised protein [Bordetella hinzii]